MKSCRNLEALGRGVATLPQRWPPVRIFWTYLGLHVLIWWLLPVLLQHNLPLDVIEQLAWGREWQIVYFKHPPLPAWIVESVAVISGRWPPALLSRGAAGLGLVADRGMATRMCDAGAAARPARGSGAGGRRLLHVSSRRNSITTWCCCRFGPRWDWPDIAPCCAGQPTRHSWPVGMGWCARRARTAGEIHHRAVPATPAVAGRPASSPAPRMVRTWPLAGARHRAGAAPAASIGIVADRLHAAVVPVRTRTGSVPLVPPHRQSAAVRRGAVRRHRGGLACAGVARMAASGRARGIGSRHTAAVRAARLSGDHHLGAGRSRGCRLGRPRPAPEGHVGLPDVVLHRAVPDGRGSRTITAGGLQRFAIAWVVILVTVPVVFTARQSIGGRFLRKPLRSAFPGPELARQIEQRWHAVAGDAPLSIVAGDVWIAGSIAFYGGDRPSVFIDADPVRSPWITARPRWRGRARC